MQVDSKLKCRVEANANRFHGEKMKVTDGAVVVEVVVSGSAGCSGYHRSCMVKQRWRERRTL